MNARETPSAQIGAFFPPSSPSRSWYSVRVTVTLAREPGVGTRTRPNRPVIGWREWVSLPDLGVRAIKAKVDTGARSSTLHAFDVQRFRRRGAPWVRFRMHPIQRDDARVVIAEARLLDSRLVRDSGGRQESRLVIDTDVMLGAERWAIELTLTNRDEMGFRMLLGRAAVRRRFVVDPASSYVIGKRPKSASKKKHK